uniref:ATPase AAA-type core domain-containing protein n=1 Tax=Castor canadensis TaxID=51338 RepID=A0A8C0WUQ7_CASCN
MVGVLAMAAAAAPPPVKDYEIEPCKKRRKDDDDGSSCKTITNYLPPIGKSGDRVFSPPKSSNIMHYFRKTSPSNEQLQSAKDCKKNLSALSPVDNSKDCKAPLEVFSNIKWKKRRKKVNLSHQLNNIKIENESPIEISSDDSKEDSGLSNDFMESSTSVLLYKKHVDILAESIQDSRNQINTMTSKKNVKKVNPRQGSTKTDRKKLRKRKSRDVIDLSQNLPLAEELNMLKKDGKGSKQTMLSLANEIESTTNDANSSNHEITNLNDSTITVSYEDFLKSHKETKVEETLDSTASVCVPFETVEIVKSDNLSESENCEIPQQVCSKTVTILAQVHPTPPRKTGKIPSIFLKQKQIEMENSLSDPENEQTVQKRKSNVVIQEEELELAVLEAASSEAVKPKCTLEERQQFMKAFRQPASDALKNGLKKSLDKQKDLNEKSLNEDGRDNTTRIMENSNIQMFSNNGSSQPHTDKGSFSKEKSKKLKKKGKKPLRTSPSESREGNTQKKETTFSLKDKQNQNRVRMSLRQKKSEVFKSSTLFDSESPVCENIANDDPVKISSPCDNNTSSRKNSTPDKDVKVIHLKAEPEDRLVNLPTPKSTRRSLRSSSTLTTVTLVGIDSEDAQDNSPVKVSTPKAANISENFGFACNTSKNISKAKQLIEKAKALHISKSKATEEIVMPLRRSSRHRTLPERVKSSQTDDSVILVDSSPTSLKQPEKNQKKLQCLNDVLGKKLSKASKNVPGKMKVAPLFLARKAQKTASPVLGFDENSQDKSEKSQDYDVQFKAKRDFLMSGLPDLLKRQIAKKAAVLDVYNAASTSFQTVVHVQQKDDGCWLWHLKPPSCPLLTKFKELNTKVLDLSKCVIALGEFSTLNSNLKSNSAVEFTRTRKDFTKEVRNILLEEIGWSNPDFSLGRYFPLLLQKRLEHQVLYEYHSKQEPDVNQKETKRKRVETENQKAKRKKTNECSVSPEKINGKSEELHKKNASFGIKLDSSKDSGTEDMLWTEKYQPQNASELIGNELAIKKLHSWLKDWKRRTELEERQNLKGKRDEKQEDFSDSVDFQGNSDDEEESRLCNTVLITGPTGVGKTAAVYACAQELGFKIFEVNASSQRSGRQILSQLKEATQSHQVDKQGVNSQKPCFFNSFNIGKSPSK